MMELLQQPVSAFILHSGNMILDFDENSLVGWAALFCPPFSIEVLDIRSNSILASVHYSAWANGKACLPILPDVLTRS